MAHGDLDIVLGKWQQQNSLCLNSGPAWFSDATVSRTPVRSDDTPSVALGDLDVDGDLDEVIGNSRQQNRLFGVIGLTPTKGRPSRIGWLVG